MNISNVSPAPKPVGNKAIESDGFAASEQTGTAEDFANALKGQEKLLQEPKTKDETPSQPQNTELTATNQPVTAVAPEDNHRDIIALMEEYFPLAKSASTETDVTTPDATALLALTAAMNQAAEAADTQPMAPEPPQDMSALLPLTGALTVKPAAPEEAKQSLPVEPDKNSNPVVSLQKYGVPAQFAAMNEGDKQSVAAATDDFQQSLTSVMGTETQPVTETKAELMPLQKPAETRVESLVIAKPLAHPGWSKDLGEHILWLNNKEIPTAEIKLNPAHLGPISIRIDVGQDNQASILFTAQHPETKEALESSLPKLREMLQGQQLNLANVNISQNPGSQHGKSAAQFFQGANGNQNPDFEDSNLNLTPDGIPEQVVSKGLLSLYA
jgi:flagellar hook-length control protein FliK